MDLSKLIQNVIPADALGTIAAGTGVDTDMVTNIAGAAAPAVLGEINSKVASDGSFLDTALSGATDGILKTVLGSQAETILGPIAAKFGISESIVSTVIEQLLPYVLKAVKSGAINTDMLSAAAGLADGVDMSDIQNIAGAAMGKKSGGLMGMLGGLLGK